MHEINYDTIQKQKKLKVKGKLGQSSVNRLLNDPSSVDPLPLKYIMAISKEKQSGKTTNHDSHCHGYAHFQPVLEHGLPPSLNLNHNFSTHSREA